jgi:hypothetical protein
MNIFTYTNHKSSTQAVFDCFIVEGSLRLDDCFRDINNYDLEGMGARYFWSDYSKLDFVDGFKLGDNRTFQLCGVNVEGSVSLLLIVITGVPGSKSQLDVLLQIEFDSDKFLDVENYDSVFNELLELIVIPFYTNGHIFPGSMGSSIIAELKAITVRLYHCIQYEFVRTELELIDNKIVKFLMPFGAKTLAKFNTEE